MTILNVLLIDDDPESLKLLRESLPETLDEVTIRWEPCGVFDEALQLIAERRFDVVASDIYLDRSAKEPVTGEAEGVRVLNKMGAAPLE